MDGADAEEHALVRCWVEVWVERKQSHTPFCNHTRWASKPPVLTTGGVYSNKTAKQFSTNPEYPIELLLHYNDPDQELQAPFDTSLWVVVR